VLARRDIRYAAQQQRSFNRRVTRSGCAAKIITSANGLRASSSNPDLGQCTDTEMTESLTPGCGFSRIGAQRLQELPGRPPLGQK
jgi:hypothetical protein